VRLTNFFMSSGLDHKKFGHNKFFSLFFMSPERIMGEVDLSTEASMFKSDLWSIGCLLYLILFGKLPFTGKNVSTLVKNILAGKLSIPKMPEEME